ncbi:Protein CBR-SRA-9, partial [Caenorhabditis briggsae]
SNLTIATPDDIDRLLSSNFLISQIVDLLAALITLISTFSAINLILTKSIFQWSTKILLFQNLCFANFFQISYSYEAMILVLKNLEFRGDSNFLKTEAQCAPIYKFMLFCTSGMIYGQTGLIIERLFSNFSKNFKSKKSIKYSLILLFFILFFSGITGPLLLFDDPLDGAVLGCFMIPKASARRSTVYFAVCTVLTLFNFCVALWLMRYNKKLEYSIRFKVGARFRKRQQIDSTETICFLSVCLFVLMFIYSVGVSLLRNLRDYLILADFYFWVVWLYTVPIFAMLLPLLLIYRIRCSHASRVQNLIGISHEKQSQDGHIK